MRFSTAGQWLILLALFIAVILAVLWFSGFAIPFVPGRSAPDSADSVPSIGDGEIVQNKLDSPRVFERNWNGWKYTITGRYEYAITARIVGKEEYHETGPEQITPIDLGIAYGEVIRPEYLPYFTFTMGNRQLSTTVSYPKYISMLPEDYWFSHVTNNHLVFADERTLAAARGSRAGDCVAIKGYLADIDGKGPGGSTYTRRTSTSRTDEYPAGCEVVYVESYEVTPC